MMKWLLASLFFVLTTGRLFAQDMPPLPPLPNQGQAASPAPAAPADNSQQGLPPLPAAGQAPATAAPSASPSDNGQAAGLPPLPGNAAPSTESAPATTAPAAPATTEANPPSAPATESALTPQNMPAEKKTSKLKPWQVSKYRPNVIFGGWVRAKGGNETSRMAWTSQEVLNALIFKKYKLISPEEGKPEEGNYEGQPGAQWRQFNFRTPHSKLAVQVYIRQDANRKIWLRVGPAEAVASAATSLSQAQKMRQADLTALHILQKKFGRRLVPNRVFTSWEAPYRYSKETADN